MKKILIYSTMALLSGVQASPQSIGFQGQLSGWTTINGNKLSESQLGIRYIPNLTLQRTLSESWIVDTELSVNTFGSGQMHGGQEFQTDGKCKPYRLWLRLSSSQFEARIGLQKINFGSAVLLRPLMWFDRIDPRDPLQLTDGVYGLLLRYYFLNNANIWLWGLVGNDETKGWEFMPSDDKSIEYGGRIQYPFPRGEIGATFHHRRVDLQKGITRLLSLADVPMAPAESLFDAIDLGKISENRIGLDGKWDVEVGLWFESALVHQDIDLLPLKYRRLMNIGLDYTFGVGNGLHAMVEHFLFEISEEAFGEGEGFEFSALSLNYPLGLIDNLTAMIYYDWENKDWYRFINWQRMYDRWSFYLIGFWNPDQFQIYQNQTENNLFAGKGLQLMIVLNH
jgi:hypothetical protein